ncbi:hypothetical protein ACT3UJ_15105 [Halomonas sp. 86]|uniref:hypothetical protein n=1 Tax=unclassified Halomonas TaxID=2609666 RepID=UPI00403318DB
MIWHLIAAIFAALAAAGIGLILRNLSRNRLPKWIVPVFAGLGMLGYQIHVEYSWFEHKQQQLPESSVIVSSATGTEVWRPWTFVFPITTQFSVVDSDNIITRDIEGDQVVEFILYQFIRRHTDFVSTQPYLLNCESRELVPLSNEAGEAQLSELRLLRETSTLLATVCGNADA